MESKDNGSSIDFVEKAKDIAENKDCPDTIEITTGNLFPKKDSLSFKNDINEELRRRFPHYVVESENDITIFSGMISVKFTKIN